MSNNNKTPAIRFKGFTDTWEQCELGTIADVTKLAGFEFTEHIVYSDEGNIIALRGLNVKNGTLVLDDVKYIDGSNFSKLSRSKLYVDDVLFTYVGTVGELAIIPENDRFYLAPNVSRIRFSKGYYAPFMVQQMGNKTFYDRTIFPLIATSSQPALSMENIRKFVVHIPKDNAEQQVVGNYFKSLDNLITLHQRKCDKLIQFKAAMLQKMFPQNGANKPEIRFRGFTDAWEQREFGEVGSVSMCKRIFKDETVDDGEIPFYKIGTFGSEPDAYISRELYEEYRSKYSYPHKGDILLSASGTIGRIVEYNGEEAYFQDSNIVWLSHDETISNLFLKTLYPIVKWNGIEGSTIKRLYNDNFLKTQFMMPSLAEQTQIGTFFSTLDHLITLHQRKCDKYKSIKSGLIRKLFP